MSSLPYRLPSYISAQVMMEMRTPASKERTDSRNDKNRMEMMMNPLNHPVDQMYLRTHLMVVYR